MAWLLFAAAALAASACASADAVPLPNDRQLEFMALDRVQFMHFGLPTFWDPPVSYLYTENPTYHDCYTTTIDRSNQTGEFYPCLDPSLFDPEDIDCDDWMRHSVALGLGEVCLTAHHEGGFALWPSNFTTYSVALSAHFEQGKGDVLRRFADAAKRWGVKICYYLNAQNDGYQTLVANATPDEFIDRQVGMVEEVLRSYGPVHRFWFDGTTGYPNNTNVSYLWERVYDTIRTQSPSTLISPTRGDVCRTTGSLLTRSYPRPNSTEHSACSNPSEPSDGGVYFHPSELHGITIQQGPNGNQDSTPTYWFWHPWACANRSCLTDPTWTWEGHANASRLFDSYLITVGHGSVLNLNIPPDRSGKMNASVGQVMFEAGQALNDTFLQEGPGTVLWEEDITFEQCRGWSDALEFALSTPGAAFDYLVTKEDLTRGQRVANYTIEWTDGSGEWQTIVPFCEWVDQDKNEVDCSGASAAVAAPADRPDGDDPRDQYIGYKRIDFALPFVNTTQEAVQAVRVVCLRALEEPVYLSQFSLHRKTVPWAT